MNIYQGLLFLHGFRMTEEVEYRQQSAEPRPAAPEPSRDPVQAPEQATPAHSHCRA